MDWNVSVPTLKTTHPCLDRVTHYAINNLGNPMDLDELAIRANVSPYYLCRLFKEHLGLSPMKWLWLQRSMVAGAYLSKNISFDLTDIAFACGFSSSAHFSRHFKSVYGMSPSRYRKAAKEEMGLMERIAHMVPSSLFFSAIQFVPFSSY